MKLIILIFGIFSSTSAQTDYCAICPNHIACNNTGAFGVACSPDAAISLMTNATIQVILSAHNAFRDKVAAGNVSGLSSATKMKMMKWSDELAYLAELNVKKCIMAHDGCIRTPQYPYDGQNIYWGFTPAYPTDMTTVIKSAVSVWSSEFKNANQADIDNCCGGTKFLLIGHFTALTKDQSDSVGCALIKFSYKGWKSMLFTCNYAVGNLLNTPVYTSGPAASQCPSGTDNQFTNLCRN